jgi:hypothetical protein
LLGFFLCLNEQEQWAAIFLMGLFLVAFLVQGLNCWQVESIKVKICQRKSR